MSSALREIEGMEENDDLTSFTPMHTFEEYARSTKDGGCYEYLSVVKAITYLHGSMEEFAEESEQFESMTAEEDN